MAAKEAAPADACSAAQGHATFVSYLRRTAGTAAELPRVAVTWDVEYTLQLPRTSVRRKAACANAHFS